MWSLGCLLYELVTGRYLFADDDWIRMFVRVTKARALKQRLYTQCSSHSLYVFC